MKEMTPAIKVYRKQPLNGWYHNIKSNYPPYVKWGLIQSLHNVQIFLMKLVVWDMIFS
jgi:hypothetical protein